MAVRVMPATERPCTLRITVTQLSVVVVAREDHCESEVQSLLHALHGAPSCTTLRLSLASRLRDLTR